MIVKRISSFTGEYYWLSNFWSGKGPKDTVEHRYQAAKAMNDQDRQYVLNAPTAAEAKKRGKKIKLRGDWESIKINRMRELLEQKFSDPTLRQQLLDTGNAELIEGNWWGDHFWGVCHGHGENWLGRLLMELRTKIALENR